MIEGTSELLNMLGIYGHYLIYGQSMQARKLALHHCGLSLVYASRNGNLLLAGKYITLDGYKLFEYRTGGLIVISEVYLIARFLTFAS